MYASGEDACDGLDPVSPRIGDEKPCDGGELGGGRPERGHTVMLEPRDETVKLPGGADATCRMSVCGGDELGCHADVELLVAGGNHTPPRIASASGFLDLHEAENSP